jgi:transcription elongation factor GreB
MSEKNYITPQGLRALTQEFNYLKFTERPEVTKVVSWAAGNGDRSENGDYIYGKKRLREIDSRLRFLAKRIESAEVIDPSSLKGLKIRFGATVTYSDPEEKTVFIVGEDEIDPARGKISWKSPLAKALMNKEPGDVVEFHTPKGLVEVEILDVTYKEIPE